MRQAGRYLPEYRATRERAGDFMTLCRTPELACEVTLQPVQRFNLDAAIIFSDILTIPDAMGLGLYFVDGEGPRFSKPLDGESAIKRLPRPEIAQALHYVLRAIRLARQELAGKVPLIGFSGSPWTLATYMVEGGSSRHFGRAKRLIYDQPALAHLLLEKLAESVVDYLNAQIEAGAQIVQVFDTWGGVLAHDAYREFSLRYLAMVVAGLKREHEGRRVPTILFSKGCNDHLEALADTGCDAVGLDWTLPLAEARSRVGVRVALQGNLDPAVLMASPDAIRREADRCLASFGRGTGHVFNLGHGITPDADPEHLAVLVRRVAEVSPSYHAQA